MVHPLTPNPSPKAAGEGSTPGAGRKGGDPQSLLKTYPCKEGVRG